MAAACTNGGLEAIRIFSTSASCNRFDLALRFWNHIFTWVSVRFRLFENSARSAIDKYCFSRNFFSNCINCCVVNGVRGFLFGLCFRSVHRSGPNAGVGGGPRTKHWAVRSVGNFLQIKSYIISPAYIICCACLFQIKVAPN